MREPNLIRGYTIHDALIRGDGQERLVEAVCVPFGTPTRVRDGGEPYYEGFDPSAFDAQFAKTGEVERVDLRFEHDSSLPGWVGYGQDFTAYPDHLRGTFKVFKGEQGDHLLNILSERQVGMSVGFKPLASEQRDGVVWRTEARLVEVSIVRQPAYPDAKVLAVRDGRLVPVEDTPSEPPPLASADVLANLQRIGALS